MSLQDESVSADNVPTVRVLLPPDPFARWSAIFGFIATIAALLAWWQASQQTNIARGQAAVERRTAAIEEKNALLEREAILVSHCDSYRGGPADGVLLFERPAGTIYQTGSASLAGLKPPFVACSLTNYGRVPALLVQPVFDYVRFNSLCDLIGPSVKHATQTDATARYKRRLRHKRVPILGIAAGASFTVVVAIANDATDNAAFQTPAVASFESPTDAAPYDRRLVGEGAKGFGRTGFTLPRRADSAPCFKR